MGGMAAGHAEATLGLELIRIGVGLGLGMGGVAGGFREGKMGWA